MASHTCSGAEPRRGRGCSAGRAMDAGPALAFVLLVVGVTACSSPARDHAARADPALSRGTSGHIAP
jgi:hypothetical protein